jgi:hypothetical protein
MRRNSIDENSSLGSFLDVVTNMVGILIILVMILGMRIKDAPITLPPDEQTIAATLELKSEQAAEQAVGAEVERTAEQVADIEQTVRQRTGERNVLATMVSAAEQQIAQRRQQLDAQSRSQFDLGQSIRDAQVQLRQLYDSKAAAQVDNSAPVQLESYPTPLGRTVTGQEVHFQLRNRRIVYVPLQELLAKAQEDLASHRHGYLAEGGEITGSYGPMEGFTMQLSIRRKERVHYLCEFIPDAQQPLGETVEEALASPNSQFRLRLDGRKPAQTTITIWVYPDSFADFRHIKKELYLMGFATAGRPLPENQHIVASNAGSQSAAE